MSLFTVFNIAASALAAQSQRLNVVASNLANAESATSPGGTPYRARQVVFTAAPVAPGRTSPGVKVTDVVEDPALGLTKKTSRAKRPGAFARRSPSLSGARGRRFRHRVSIQSDTPSLNG
jgi:flagellar basal body rod protein FlgC